MKRNKSCPCPNHLEAVPISGLNSLSASRHLTLKSALLCIQNASSSALLWFVASSLLIAPCLRCWPCWLPPLIQLDGSNLHGQQNAKSTSQNTQGLAFYLLTCSTHPLTSEKPTLPVVARKFAQLPPSPEFPARGSTTSCKPNPAQPH